MTTLSAIAAGQIDSESPLDTVLAGQWSNNWIAALEGDATASAHRVQQAAMEAASIGQNELKMTTGSGSVSVSGTSAGSITLSGGTYAMWTASADTDNDGITFGNGNTAAGTIGLFNSQAGALTFYYDSRYFQASPPYDLGDGDIPLFIFLIVDNATKNILGTYIAPEAPWHYNGITNITATSKDKVSGRSYRKCNRVDYERYLGNFTGSLLESPNFTDQEKYDIITDNKEYKIELTQAIKNRDMADIPHPFLGNNLTGKTIVLLDPVSPIAQQLLTLHETGEDIRELIYSKYITFGNNQIPRVTPNQVMTTSIAWKNTGK